MRRSMVGVALTWNGAAAESALLNLPTSASGTRIWHGPTCVVLAKRAASR